MTISKRIFSIFLVFVLCFAICFQCQLVSQAVFGVDDALLIAGLTCELLGAGITIYSVSQFVQSDTFRDFSESIAANIDRELSLVKRNGQLFFSLTSLGWHKLQSWVKNHFNGGDTKTIDFETSTTPGFLTCSDGTTLPYLTWMQYPFFIYNSVDTAGRKWAYWVTEQNAGMIVLTHSVQIFCYPKAEIHWGFFQDGTFTDNGQFNSMTNGFYKGQLGGYQIIDFNNKMHPSENSWYQYRTIDIIVDSSTGSLNPNFNTQTIPDGTGTASVTAHSDAEKYPGAIDAPTSILSDGESMLVKVPDDLVVDDGQGNLSITTDSSVIADTLAETTVADVHPKVSTYPVDVVVDNVIADTVTPEITGSAQSDIETANKFRLPRSFLEGFPFSIPYSVFVGIKSFVAESQPPVFDIPFNIDRLGISESVSIDLSSWSPVARLCRALLSVVWVAGLAMACSKFIKR